MTPSGYHDGRDVEAGGGHHHARDYFVAVRDQDETVQGVSFSHRLDGIADELAAGQRVFHAFVSHGDAVADADGRKFHRGPAGQEDSFLNGLSYAVQEKVARNQLVLCVYDADERTVDFLSHISHSVKERTDRRSARSLLDLIAVHFILFLSRKSGNVLFRFPSIISVCIFTCILI